MTMTELHNLEEKGWYKLSYKLGHNTYMQTTERSYVAAIKEDSFGRVYVIHIYNSTGKILSRRMIPKEAIVFSQRVD